MVIPNFGKALMNDTKISILDIFIILLEKKRFLFTALLLISIATVTGTFFMKKSYTASATLLPAKSSSLSSPLSALMGDLPVGNLMKSFDFLEGGSDNDQFISILESRRLAESVVRRFNLAKRYKFTEKKNYFIEDVIIAFHRNFEAYETDLKNIIITYSDTNPAFTAEVVNFIIGELDSINFTISRDNARNTRLFFEERLSVVKKEMDSAHAKLADFQEKNNFLDLEEQVSSSIGALSRIEAQLLSNDVNIELLKNRYGADGYEVRELKKSRRVLEERMNHYLDSGSGQLILPLKKAPRLGIEYTYLLKNVKVQEMLHAFLLQNYEQAKLTEANTSPTVTVLEYAQPPQKKSRPKRAIICFLAFTISFILLSFWILVMKWFSMQREGQTEVYKKLLTVGKFIGRW